MALPLDAHVPSAAGLTGDAADDAAMERMRNGDRLAFAELVRRHETNVKRYLARMIGPAEAQDVAQETFVALWTLRASYQPQGRFKSLLYRVARSRAFSHLRWRKVRTLFAARPTPDVTSASMAAPADGDGALAELLKREATGQLNARLAQLPADVRDLLILKFVEELSYAEMAEVTGVSQVALRSRVCRAVGLLAKQLEHKTP